jgi:hypothetical protein
MNTNLQGHSLPLQFGVLKVQDHADTQAGYPKIIQHQSTFVVADAVDHFRIHDDGIKGYEVGNEEPNVPSFVEDVERRLLPKRNFSEAEFDGQGILVRLLD